MCTHPFQFLSVAKDEVDRRKGTLWEKGDNACTKKVWWQEQVLQALDEQISERKDDMINSDYSYSFGIGFKFCISSIDIPGPVHLVIKMEKIARLKYASFYF